MRRGNVATNADSQAALCCSPWVTEAVAVVGHRTYQMALSYMAQRRASGAAMAAQEGRNEP